MRRCSFGYRTPIVSRCREPRKINLNNLETYYFFKHFLIFAYKTNLLTMTNPDFERNKFNCENVKKKLRSFYLFGPFVKFPCRHLISVRGLVRLVGLRVGVDVPDHVSLRRNLFKINKFVFKILNNKILRGLWNSWHVR